MDRRPGSEGAASGVRSLDRSLLLLELLADAGEPMRLAELEAASGLPLPTVHRLVRALVHNGYVHQEPSRRYALGARLIRLGEMAAKGLGSRAMPELQALVEQVQETANMALLDGDEVVYVAQVPSAHAMRMFTEVGRRVGAHCTGVGKALLAQLPPDQAAALLRRTGLPARTPHTITELPAMLAELDRIRQDGWAVDHGEEELGVRCVAAPVLGAPARIAISVSGPSARVTEQRVASIGPVVRRSAQAVAAALAPDAGDAERGPS